MAIEQTSDSCAGLRLLSCNFRMFCSRFEKVLGLDISYHVVPKSYDSMLIEHHKNYSALCQSAQSGCDLYHLACLEFQSIHHLDRIPNLH